MARKTKTPKKSWYKIIAPNIFNDVEVSETLTDDPKKLKNRLMKIGLKKVMQNSDKHYVYVFLQVKSIEGEKALTVLKGHDCTRSYIFRLARKGSTKLDIIQDVKTKDGSKIRVKLVAITLKRTESATKHDLRAKISEMVVNAAAEKDFNGFMTEIFLNSLQKKILRSVKTIYPLRVLEVRKTEVL